MRINVFGYICLRFDGNKEVFFKHTWYTRIADENENRAYRANRYDDTQNRFEYRRKRSIGNSSALARNETRLVSNETRLVALETSLERNETD